MTPIRKLRKLGEKDQTSKGVLTIKKRDISPSISALSKAVNVKEKIKGNIHASQI